jgi:hypothetical protein
LTPTPETSRTAILINHDVHGDRVCRQNIL